MSLRALLVVCLALAAVAPVLADEGPAHVQLEVGGQRHVTHSAAIGRVAIADPKVADVRALGPREFLVLGRAPGTTSITVWSKDPNQPPDEIAVAVVPYTGIAERAVESASHGQLKLSQGSGVPVLEGEASSVLEHRAALDAREQTSQDRSVLGFDHQVQVDIKIVDVSRRGLKQAGLTLLRNTSESAQAITPPGILSGISGQGASSAANGFVFSSGSGFLPFANAYNLVAGKNDKGLVGVLSLLEQAGYARTLAEPSLVVTSGQSASFLAGGEFPVPVAQGGGSSSAISIEYREFGVKVLVRPTVVSKNRIVLKIAPEVSDLDFSSGVSVGGVTVPALTTRRADTTVEIGDGESLVIGGLISERMSSNADKVPFLADVPVLGAFLRSSRLTREDRELLMVVSPKLVRALAEGADLPPLPGAEAQGFDPSMWNVIRGRVIPRRDDAGFAP